MSQARFRGFLSTLWPTRVKDVIQERSMEAILRTLREAYAREEQQSTTIVYFL
jgi:hypothetical protein